MTKGSVKLGGIPTSEAMQNLLEALPSPDGLDEAVSFIEISARLVQAAAFEVAPKISEAEVVDLVQLAAQLEAHAKRLRGVKMS